MRVNTSDFASGRVLCEHAAALLGKFLESHS
jgi:hypothetical protein